MNQDVNKIIDVVSVEWSNQLMQANKKVAVLAEENERLKHEIDQLKKDKEDSAK